MRTLLTLLLAGVAFADGPAYTLPAEPGAVVVHLDYVGPDGTWTFTIRADGRARVNDVDGRLGAGLVQDILHDVVGKARLFEWDGKRVEAAMRKKAGAGKHLLPVEDAPTTVLRVRLRDRRVEVRQHAVQTAAELYPSIAALRRLEAATRRLDVEANILRAGGRSALAGVVKRATSAMRAPGDAPLLYTELASVVREPGGSVRATFRREESRGVLRVVATRSGRGKWTVNVADDRRRYALPDADTTVLSYDLIGREEREPPLLAIRADGRVLLKGAPRRTLTDKELHDLLHFVATEQQFLRWDADDVRRRIRATLVDGTTTIVRLRLRTRRIVAAQAELRESAAKNAHIPELARFDAIARRLHRLYVQVSAKK